MAASEGATYAERLRGARFWVPLVVLLAAAVVSLVVVDAHRTKAPLTPAAQPLVGVDPTITSLVRKLEAGRIFCGAVRATTPQHASCLIGAVTSRTTFRSFTTHRQVIAALPAMERASKATFTRSKVVSFLVAGRTWVITGTWSPTGSYADTSSPEAASAQAITQQLNGCLELLPRESGSCSF
jgi:hypothetical protein